jgi:hypothetical protein
VFSGYEELETDPTQEWESLVLIDRMKESESTPAPNVTRSDGGPIEVRSLSPSARPGFLSVEIPGGAIVDSVRLTGSMTTCNGQVTWQKQLHAPIDARTAEPGKGAMLWVAAFFADGELFWTNMAPLAKSNWPKLTGYHQRSSNAWPVYVYSSSPDERPLWWAVANDGGAAQFEYDTAPYGVNEALKGLSASTSRVFSVAAPHGLGTAQGFPEAEGRSQVFWIKVAAVQDAPCPYSDTAFTICNLPASPSL